jgi:hypothetical protein
MPASILGDRGAGAARHSVDASAVRALGTVRATFAAYPPRSLSSSTP